MEDRTMSDFEQVIVNEEGQTVTVGVRKPKNQEMKEADIHRAKAWNKAFKEGVMMKAEVDQVMRDRGLWDEDKATEENKLTEEILRLERRLYIGDGKTKPKVSEGRGLALEMKNKRFRLRDLISERISMDENTAESIADNARFDYLVFACSFNVETGESLFESYEDYNERGSNIEAITSAQLLAQMVYNLDSDFEDKLPENKFLKQFNLIDGSGQLVDPNTGELVDYKGNKVNSLGHYVDEEGNRVDLQGNKINEDGLYEMVDYEDDLTVKKPKKAAKKRTPRKKAVTKVVQEEAEEAVEEAVEEVIEAEKEEAIAETA
jgi:hypothetical protein